MGAPGYVSHSFNQFILINEDGQLVSLNHGDGFPRGLILHTYSAKDGIVEETGSNLFMTIPGNLGDNTTGCAVGVFVEAGDAYLTAYAYDGRENPEAETGPRNLFVTFINKDTGEAETSQITFNGHACAPQVASISKNEGYILWEETDSEGYPSKFRYIKYTGSTLGDICEVDECVQLSDCQPIVWKDKFVWYATELSAPVFYVMDETGVQVYPAI